MRQVTKHSFRRCSDWNRDKIGRKRDKTHWNPENIHWNRWKKSGTLINQLLLFVVPRWQPESCKNRRRGMVTYEKGCQDDWCFIDHCR